MAQVIALLAVTIGALLIWIYPLVEHVYKVKRDDKIIETTRDKDTLEIYDTDIVEIETVEPFIKTWRDDLDSVRDRFSEAVPDTDDVNIRDKEENAQNDG